MPLNIDLGEGGLHNISLELVGTVILVEKCRKSWFVTRGFGKDCSMLSHSFAEDGITAACKEKLLLFSEFSIFREN